MGNKKSNPFKNNQGSGLKIPLPPLEAEFDSIESEFKRLDELIKRTEKLLKLSYESFSLNLTKYFCPDRDNHIKEIILQQRNELVRNLVTSEKLLYFRESSVLIEEFLTEDFNLRLNPKWNIFEKLKYMDFFSRFQKVDFSSAIENNGCYNYIVIPLSKRKFFICMGLFYKRSFLKITNNLGQELRRREIDKSYYYRQFVAFGKRIVGLYEVVK